jgi:hypothetical protein
MILQRKRSSTGHDGKTPSTKKRYSPGQRRMGKTDSGSRPRKRGIGGNGREIIKSAIYRTAALLPEFLIFPIFSNICYQNVDFRVTNGDENRFIMA